MGKFKTVWGEWLYLCTVMPMAGFLGYWFGQQKSTGMFGPIKTKHYSTVQHWLKTGGGVGEDEPIPEGVEWLEWNELPQDSRKPEWFCWQRSGETPFEGFSFRRFINAHVRRSKD